MKSIVKSSFYFSAYPLKAISGTSSAPTASSSPYLKAVLSAKGKRPVRGKVLPMINPYNNQVIPAPFEDGKLPKDIDQVQKEWFNNYE